ncbi:MAG: hypothetical protein OYH76_09080 [Defluviicoccus sp.]|nr:hypothetical protein [Defluviicoccus sp.]MDE0276036.1 hypothetical protein [Defluviicoccus sp.]
MSLRENVTQSVTLFAATLPAFVLGFGGMWIGMQSIASDIRADIRTEIGQMRGEISNLSQRVGRIEQRVARIEGRLGIPAPPPNDRAATDPANPQPAPDTPDRPTVDG